MAGAQIIATALCLAGMLASALSLARLVAAPVALAQSALVLSATFSSILATVPCTAQEAPLEYKRSADAAWLPAMALWRANGTCSGSIVLLDASTAYDVRATVDGVVHQGTVTTRAEAITPTEALVPTHCVRLDGSDTNSGAIGSCWRTLRKAHQSAPPGAVVVVGSGQADEYFVDAGYSTAAPVRTMPLTLVAAAPALAPNGAVTPAGHRAIIEGAVRAAPTGVADPEIPTAPWVQVSLVGPTDGVARSVWKWTGAVPGGGTLHTLGWLPAAGRAGVPNRAAKWASDAARLATPEGWAELLHTNQTFRYGFYQSGADLYVRLPNDANPNARWWVGGTAGVSLGGADSRVSGFVLRGLHMAVVLGPGSSRTVVDRNEIQMATHGVRVAGVGASGPYPEDMVFERNYVRNTGLWSDNQSVTPTPPWDFVKRRVRLADGTEYPTTRIGGTMEGSAFIPVGANKVVVRHNTIQGTWDGIGTVNIVSPFSPTQTEVPQLNDEWDIHDNVIRQIPDDPFEPGAKANWRIWKNTLSYTKTFMSTGTPTRDGAMLIFHNTAWRIGGHGLAPDLLGGDGGGRDGIAFKADGQGSPGRQARIYVVGNTFWSDWEGTYPNGTTIKKAYGWDDAAGSGSYAEAFWLRNNLFRLTDTIWDFYSNGPYSEDYDQFATTAAAKGIRRTGVLGAPSATYLTIGAYRSGEPGQGMSSNLVIPDLHDAASLDGHFVNAGAGNLALTAGSALRTAGVAVPNLTGPAPVGLGAP